MQSSKPTKHADVIMPDTGELVAIKLADSQKYSFLGGWRAMGILHITNMLKADLSANQWRVAMWLSMICKRNNIVVVTGKMAEQQLAIERHAFSRIIAVLIQKDMIKRGEVRGAYYINPQWCWSGNASDHKLACSSWYDRRPNLVAQKIA
jgi:hypothetical protein